MAKQVFKFHLYVDERLGSLESTWQGRTSVELRLIADALDDARRQVEDERALVVTELNNAE